MPCVHQSVYTVNYDSLTRVVYLWRCPMHWGSKTLYPQYEVRVWGIIPSGHVPVRELALSGLDTGSKASNVSIETS